jgi:hypothetical protein
LSKNQLRDGRGHDRLACPVACGRKSLRAAGQALPAPRICTMSADVIPPCPFHHLVDILCCVGVLRRAFILEQVPGIEKVDEILEWLALRIHTLKGIHRADLLEAAHRLAEGQGLEGAGARDPDDAYGLNDSGYLLEGYAVSQRDLSYVPRALHELDNDEVCIRALIWRRLYRRWRIIRSFYHETYPSKGEPVGAREARQPNPLLPASPDTILAAAAPVALPSTKTIALTPQSGTGKPATVHQRMLEHIHNNSESVGWSQRAWADFLGCSPAAVAAAPAWETVKKARAVAKVERLDQRKRRHND